MFITFEGIDGSGKSTQISRTAKWLREQEYNVLVSREPGGSPLGEAIREILLDPRWHAMVGRAEFFLYSASRAQLVDELVRPHLTKPRAVVILDRYDDSSTAYQGGGRELGLETIRLINLFATSGLVPEVTFVLDVDWKTSCQRRQSSGVPADRLEQNAREFFDRVRQTYHELAKIEPKRIVLLNAADREDIIFTQIQEILSIRMKLK